MSATDPDHFGPGALRFLGTSATAPHGPFGVADTAVELDRRLAAGRNGARVLVVVYGDAGQGKTTLLEHVAADAEGNGSLVVALTGRSPDEDIPYAGIRSLLTTHIPVVASPASPAQRMIRALATDFLPPRSALAVCGAITAWIDCLAPHGSCVVCVDDADQVDEESLRVLTYVASRQAAGRVTIVLTATRAVALLERVGATPIALDDLNAAEAETILRDYGVRDQQGAEIVARLGGNPLALTFAGQSVAASPATPLSHHAPAPLHPRLEADVRQRVESLPRPSAYLLEAAAVNRSGDLPALSAWSAHGDLGSAEALLPAAEDAGLITTEHDTLRWHRPWMAEGVIHLCPAGRRERLRAQFASASNLVGPSADRVAASGGGVGLFDRLTHAEVRVATAVIEGASTKQAAGRLSVSERTIDSHLQHIYRKLDVRSRSQLVATLLPLLRESDRDGR